MWCRTHADENGLSFTVWLASGVCKHPSKYAIESEPVSVDDNSWLCSFRHVQCPHGSVIKTLVQYHHCLSRKESLRLTNCGTLWMWSCDNSSCLSCWKLHFPEGTTISIFKKYYFIVTWILPIVHWFTHGCYGPFTCVCEDECIEHKFTIKLLTSRSVNSNWCVIFHRKAVGRFFNNSFENTDSRLATY